MAPATEIIDFELERGRHGSLLGREDVLTELDALLLGGGPRGWVLVKGGLGLGKSALLTEWLRRREAAGQRVPHHFLQHGVEDRDRPEVVKRNLAAQTEKLYPELVDSEARPESRLSKLLVRVSQVLGPRQEQLVLMVDGLDEVEEDADGSNPLSGFLPPTLPPGVKVLCASRPTYPHLSWLEARDGLRTIDLDDERWARSNRQVVREYWARERASSRFNPPLAQGFVEEIVQRAEGNILYSVKLAEWLEAQPVEKRQAELLPRGLEALLDESWERIQKLSPDLRGLAEEGLGVMAVARDALPRSILSDVAGWRELGEPDRFLRVARSFLLEEEAPGRNEKAWRPFHESFRRFVLTKLGAERARVLHSRMAGKLCQWPLGRGERGFRRSYALRHGVTHLLKAEQWEQARKLYTDMGYLEKRCQEAGVLSLEEALKSAVVEVPEPEQELARALLRAIQAGSHVLKRDAKALPLHVYNWLRCGGWERERIEKELGFPEGMPELRLRHPVRAGAHERTLEGHRDGVNGCVVTPDGRYVVSASADGTLKVWEVETGREVATLKGHEGEVTGCAVTPDGRSVVSTSGDRTLKVWQMETGQEVATLKGHEGEVTCCAVTPDGRRVVSSSEDKTLKVWEVKTGREVATLKGHEGRVRGCVVTPDGLHVVSTSVDKTLRVWEVETGREVAVLKGHEDKVRGCAVTPDGRRVVSASEDKTLKVWEVKTGREVATLKGHKGKVRGCAVTPDGRHVVSTSDDGTLKLWELESGREVATLEGHWDWVNGCAVTPDGGRVVSASGDKTLKVWQVGTGQEVATLKGHESWVTGCAVTPDGRHVVSASDDRTLRVWEVETGREVAVLKGHEDKVRGCAVTSDGRRVVSASEDGTLKVWDLRSGQCLYTLHGFNGFLTVAIGLDFVCAGDVRGNVWILETGSSVARIPVDSNKATSPVTPTPMTFFFPPPLLDAYRSRKLALCIGSGLSFSEGVQGNFPKWLELPQRFLDACERQGVLDAEIIAAKRTQFAKKMRLEVMLAELGTLVTALGRSYQDALNDIFRPPNAAPGLVHHAIAHLRVGAILTTNYDPLIEDLGETPRRQPYTWKEADRALNDLQAGRRILFKIHGTAERYDTVVITEREYDGVRSNTRYQSVLRHLLQEYMVLFLGYGMNDPFDIDLVLKWNADVFNSAARRHYALLKDPSDTDSDRYLRDHNVQVLPYSDYAALPGILEALKHAGP
ncbi:SIR2 family protein [Archangium violaceum]|uniref:SIR2 family protein n=1 Tax=Archangium violaceum TaxID=83451 RepID=UPI00194EDD27|nr:SIR2 family protein [Archangium violaceum]QRN92995.1 SIR2 family protein [Archangium violaceum]